MLRRAFVTHSVTHSITQCMFLDGVNDLGDDDGNGSHVPSDVHPTVTTESKKDHKHHHKHRHHKHRHQWLLCQACRWLHIHFWRSPHTSLLLFIPHTWHTHTLAVTHNTDCEQLLYIFILCNIEKLYLIIIFKLCAMHTDLCALWFDCFVIYVVVIVH